MDTKVDVYDYDGFVELSRLKMYRNIYFGKYKMSKIESRISDYLEKRIFPSITIDKDLNVLDGHMSVITAIYLGFEYVPFIMVDRPDNIDMSHTVPVGEVDVNKIAFEVSRLLKGEHNYDPEYNYLFNKQKRICLICKRFITIDKTYKKAEYADIMYLKSPKIGGSLDKSNKALVCKRCKELKGDLPYSETLRKIISAQREYEIIYNKGDNTSEE